MSHQLLSKLHAHFYSSFMFVVAGVAHRLHSKHGKNVVLLGEGCQAVRVGGYSHGIVFSAKELKADELFEVRDRADSYLFFFFFTCHINLKLLYLCIVEKKYSYKKRHSFVSPSWFPSLCISVSRQVRIDEVDEQWSGSLHIGLTTLAPPEPPSCPLSGLSPSLPQLRTKVTWLLCGSEVRRNGVLQRQNYGCSLDRLTVSCSLLSELWTQNTSLQFWQLFVDTRYIYNQCKMLWNS